jgi:hypothetical protein
MREMRGAPRFGWVLAVGDGDLGHAPSRRCMSTLIPRFRRSPPERQVYDDDEVCAGMEPEHQKIWQSSSIPTWGCFLLATLMAVLTVIWRMHDKGTDLRALWASGWTASLPIFLPSIIIAGAVLAASIFNYKAPHQERVLALPIEGGKPKWRKLQWANTELRRLETENIGLKEELAKAKTEASELASKVASSPSEPKLKIHRAVYGAGGHTNVDITDKLQKAHRDALFVPVDNNLVSKDPCPGVRKWLSVEYSYGDGVVLFAKRPESMPGDIVKLVLPEYKDEREVASVALLQQAFTETKKRADEFQNKFAVCANEKRQLEEKLNEVARQEPTLRLRIIKTCDDLAGFLLEHGSKPRVDRGIGEDEASFVGRQAMSTLAWKDKMGADFRLRFGQSVPRLRDEIRIRSAFSEIDLDNAIAKAESQYCDADAVDTIRWKFWSLAGKITA